MRCALAFLFCIALAGCRRSDDLPTPTYSLREFQYGRGDAAETIRAAEISEKFLAETKARPLIGRVFLPEEFRKREPRVVVVANSFWQRRLGGDPSAIGRKIQLTGLDFTIIGIMPAAFQIPAGAELLIPGAAAN
ncbi:MAG TPA: ABC transporter permease [Bryobacteraceae bacterium]|jgi:putative ABC transport system permease protein|nr:ABC transporter permease [Bryobacteraceae bacterium]